MNAHDVRVGVRVRLSEDGRARRLWNQHSESTATVRDVKLVDNGSGKLCVKVNVDTDRRSRIRTMQLDCLDIVQ